MQVKGMIETTVGYTGENYPNPAKARLCAGQSKFS